jgi:predicted AAA+ superfamily ATPase
MNANILRTVVFDNPWIDGKPLGEWYERHLPGRYLPRNVVLRPGHRVCLVVGPRQAGKSTLIWKTLADAGRPALYLNCEEPAVREWLTSAAAFLADLHGLGEPPSAVFLEEAQHLPEARLFLKGLVDRRPGFGVFATGSSSFDLEASTRESLAGRAVRHLLLPLSLAEATGPLPRAAALAVRKQAEAMRRMLVFGGYPTVHLSQEAEREAAGLVEAFVIRDASDRFRVQRLSAFRKVLELAASQVGSLCNYSEWASLSGVSNDTVDDYIDLLEQAHVVRTVRPFAGGKRSEITRARKVFFIDNGLRNALFGGFAPADRRPDAGALMENLVFGEIAKTVNPLLDGLHYWRSKAGGEVDFVVEHRGRLLPIEVKTGGLRGRLSRGIRSFIDAYAPETFLVVSGDEPSERNVDKTRVRFARPWEVAGIVGGFVSG